MVDTSRPEPSRSLRSAVLRAFLLIAAIVVALAVIRLTPLGEFVDRERLTHLLERLRETAWAAPALIALYVILAPLGVPVSPLILTGGAVFGPITGWLLNIIGALLGAIITFFIGQTMGRDLVIHVVSTENLKRAEDLLENHGFWAIVRIRFLPIPFALVNYGAALAGVRFGSFLVATALGLAPSLVIYTTLSYALVTVTAEDRIGVAVIGATAIVTLIALTFAPALLRAMRGRKSDP
ncbi:MAG: TVP38/TMEM64 family protein [Acidobacteriota bacterium]|nr:TVP38/TMEM64 family protein [Acidobacteriota bacterium]